MDSDDLRSRLVRWLSDQLPDATDVRVDGLSAVDFGHSAETLLLTVDWVAEGGHHEDVVLRLEPPAPGLLPPYDLQRQFDVLRSLEATAVRSPRALWIDTTGDVLGRPFYLMERLDGSVYEQEVPDGIAGDPAVVRRMSESLVEQLAAIHTVDLDATGLSRIADGYGYLASQLDHWAGEIDRVRRGPLPALDRLIDELRAGMPEQCPHITLVHGDSKPGNFAYTGTEVSAIYDWELATVGDPLTDIGWTETVWPLGFTGRPGALSADEMVALWSELTGIEARNRTWYRAFQSLKMSAIMLVGAMLFDAGHSDDQRMALMGYGVQFVTQAALEDLGVDEPHDPGPVMPRDERMATLQ
jgi:aminoglycoside phosphotransferase (APT) family kinase protein